MYFWRDAIFVVKFRHARHHSPPPPHYYRTFRRCDRLLEIATTMQRRCTHPKRRQLPATDRRRPPPRRTMATTRRPGFGTAQCKLPTRDAAPDDLALRERWQQRSRQQTTLASIASILSTRATSPSKYLAAGFDHIIFQVFNFEE